MKRRVCPLHLLLFDIHTISRRSLLLLTCLVTSKLFCGIYVSQVGYRPSDPKYVLVDQAADSFYVADASSGTIRFSGKFRLWRSSDPVSGLTIYRGDFPGFATPGLYRIKTSGGVQSQTFAVHDTVYNAVWRKSLKGFFFQRCGTALSSTRRQGSASPPLCRSTP